MKYYISRRIPAPEEDELNYWRCSLVPEKDHKWIAKSLHITILYIGHMDLTIEQHEELKDLVRETSALSEPLTVTNIRAGAWDPPVVLMDLSDPQESIQKQYLQFYNWCKLNGKKPEMTCGGDGKHPGAHITIALPSSRREAEDLAEKARASFYNPHSSFSQPYVIPKNHLSLVTIPE